MRMTMTSLWTILFAAASPLYGAQDATVGLSVILKAKADHVRIGEPIIVAVTLTNVSGHRLPVLPGSVGTDIDVFDEAGHPAKTTLDGIVLKGGSYSIPQGDGSFILSGDQQTSKIMIGEMKPRESSTHDIVLTRFFEFSQPGVYTIRAKRSDVETHAQAISNTIKITVVP